MTTLIPIVGMHFRPPAAQFILALSSGTALRLITEPDNPFDPKAVAVWCNLSELPPASHPRLAATLPDCGWTLDMLLGLDELHLGYLAAPTNKRLFAKMPIGESWESNLSWQEQDRAELIWSVTGQPLAQLAD